MRKTLYFITVTLFLCTILPLNAWATGEPTINRYQADLGDDGVRYTSIGGDKAVYQNKDSKIGIYDFSTNTASVLPYSGWKPSVYENNLAWLSGSSRGFVQVLYYNLVGVEEPVTITSTATTAPPYVYKNLIGYTDTLNGSDEISHCVSYVYNINTQEKTRISPEVNQDFAKPVIYENFVIFYGESGEYQNKLYVYDLEHPENGSIEIATDIQGQGLHVYDIDGNKITWGTSDGAYYYNLDTDQDNDGTPNYLENPKHIDDVALVKIYDSEIPSYTSPQISGDYIVYSPNTGGGIVAPIYLYNIVQQETFLIDDQTDPCNHDISNGRIIWGDESNCIEPNNIPTLEVAEISLSGSTPPTYEPLPGDTRVVNLTEGELITTNPYIINVNPDDDTAIEKVEFYVDGILICTDTEADTDGVYSCAWDTSKYHSDIRIVAYDIDGNNSEITRTVNVDPSLYTLPRTGMNIFDYVRYIINTIFGR